MEYDRRLTMAARGARTIGDLPARARWIDYLRTELLLAALLILTVAAVLGGDTLLERRLILDKATVANMQRAPLSDQFNDGQSTARETSPLAWECELKAGFAYPYCGYEIYFGRQQLERGIDLSNLRSVTLRLRYDGPASSVRMHMKNFDPAYARSVLDDTPKFNRIEHEITPGKMTSIHLDRLDFGVADWWLALHDIPPKLGHAQFDNIVSLDIQSGSNAPLGKHRFAVESIEIRRSALTRDQWYLGLLALWVLAIGAHLAHRILRLRGEVEHRRALADLARAEADQATIAARHDPMTALLNRRGLAEATPDADAGPLAVMMVDLDRFKRLNDTYGHLCGDRVIIGIARVLQQTMRPGDVIGRWGGEEFILICPGLTADTAMAMAEQLRQAIEQTQFIPCGAVTASIGLCVSSGGVPLDDLIAAADRALYTAKNGGRNQVAIAAGIDTAA